MSLRIDHGSVTRVPNSLVQFVRSLVSIASAKLLTQEMKEEPEEMEDRLQDSKNQTEETV